MPSMLCRNYQWCDAPANLSKPTKIKTSLYLNLQTQCKNNEQFYTFAC